MQVTETNTDGLSRGFTIVVPASDIDDRVQTRLKEVGRKARLPGFRPGKVPMQILKQRFGRSVMGEVLEGAVNETSRKAIDERGLRPATQPKIEIKSFEEGSDLEFEMHVEVLPEIGEVDLSGIELER
ncbi:MAG: trigger factor family protein, partial [Azospirillaceae bacterium]